MKMSARPRDPASSPTSATATELDPSHIGSPETRPAVLVAPDVVATRSASATSPAAPAHTRVPERIGRFLVIESLGAGGMGIVVAAYDPTLDRKVAIKVLHGEGWRTAVTHGRSRLVAEAQAMASLSHPNVVKLHELGFDGDSTFLVMELVPGTTLHTWLHAAERPTREIVALFAAAGDGLAAAHRQDLVHRDFKPDNVLVGLDGRARVTDFGLAAFNDDTETMTPRTGTLSYMAPEQLRGEHCDERTDQFAFCVALWEALHGTPPFAGTTFAERLTAIEAGQLVEPERRPPEWLRDVVRRGLAASPTERWPSMSALLARLRRQPPFWQHRLAAAVMAALGATALWLAWSGRQDEHCASAAARMAQVWGIPQQARLIAAFAATHAPFAGPVWRETRDRLDRYAAHWTAAANATCRATRIAHTQSDDVMDRRMRCLEDRRHALAALAEAWVRGADQKAVERAIDAAGQLPRIEDCSDDEQHRVVEPGDALSRSRILAARQQLDAMRAALLTLRLDEAKRLMPGARTAADATGWPPIRAEEALAEGEVLSAVSDPRTVDRLRDASQLADVARDDHLRLDALTHLAMEVAERAQDGAEALRIVELAEGVLARAGNDELFRVRLVRARGRALSITGDYPAARELQQRMLPRLTELVGASTESVAAATDLAYTMSTLGDYAAAIALYDETANRASRVLGEDHPVIIRLRSDEATTIFDGGDVPRAIALYDRVLAASRRVFGSDSAYTALVLNNIGRVKGMTGDNIGAREMFQQALEIRLRVLGPDHPFVATTMGNLASVEANLGNYEHAKPMLERALAIKLKKYGADHASVAYTLLDMAAVAEAQGDVAGAAASAQRSYEIRRKALGVNHELTLEASGIVAHIAVIQHGCAKAAPQLERALTALTKSASGALSTHPLLIDAAKCDLEANQPARALARIATIHSLAKKEGASERGAANSVAARAEWRLGHRARAVELARQSVSLLSVSKADAKPLAEVKAWLAAHGGRAR